jgi:hypothetical protein
MRKHLLLLGIATLSLSQAAFGTEHWTDSGFDNPAYPTSVGAGWSIASSKLTGTTIAVTKVAKTDPTILDQHTYRVSGTILTRTQGSVRIYLGAPKHGATGSNIASPNGLNGEFDIPDNFSGGLTAGTAHTPGENGVIFGGAETTGDFRFSCYVFKYSHDDPMLQYNLHGGTHLHQFFSNMAVSDHSTYKTLRKTGGTSCGSTSAPHNRSSYWTPAMLDGLGHVVQTRRILVYYKRQPKNYVSYCNAVPSVASIGICTKLPNGLKFIFGYNMSTMAGGPLDPSTPVYNFITFECWAGPSGSIGGATGTYHSIEATRAAGCPTGALLHVTFQAPNCWDGINIDAADHRSNMAYPGTGTYYNVPTFGAGLSCPADHPYVLPLISYQFFYLTDAAFVAGKWHFSSDVSLPGMTLVAGETAHLDYFEGWSPTTKAKWSNNCIDNWEDCGGGDLGDGTKMIGANVTEVKQLLLPETQFGMTPPISAVGNFSYDVKADSSGEMDILSEDGFSGTLDSLHIVDVTPSRNHVPLQTHHKTN